MIDSNQETTGKSLGISGRENEGVGGPSREVSQRDQIVSGSECAGQAKNSELEWAKQHVMEEPAPVAHELVPQPRSNVFRKTDLHGTTTVSTPDKGKKTRRRMIQSLKNPGAPVSYPPFETAFRDFICSLMERQDMMGEDLLLYIADLQQQIDALEDQLNKIRKTVPHRDPEAEP
jgi:hypothetical protein